MEDTDNKIDKAEETEVVIEKNVQEGITQEALKMQSAGYSYIYDPITGDRSVVNNNMRAFNLKKKRPDGTPRFIGTKPKNPPHPTIPGTYRCRLHKDDPGRKQWDAMGFAVCPKDDLASPYQVIRHMEKRHKSEWATMQYDEAEKRRQEDRAFQGAMLEGLRGKPAPEVAPTEAPLYVSDKDKKKKSLAS